LSYFLNLLELAKDVILPPLCTVCGKISPDYLCSECNSNIKVFGLSVCTHCGRPLKIENSKDLKFSSEFCSLCKNEQYYFFRARSYCSYEGGAAKIIHKYKYNGYTYLGKILSGFLKRAYEYYYSKEEIDFIDTVPEYSETNRLIVNRYQSDVDAGDFTISHDASGNHMKPLVLLLSKFTGIPFADNLVKIKQTPKQQKLDRDSRKVNLSDAFKIKNCLNVHGRNFLIIDDVWTTGSTLNEISYILKKSGANKIFLLTLARPV